MFESVLIPTDGSEGVQSAATHGMRIAEMYDATVHSLYVVEPIYLTDYVTDDLIAALRAQGERVTRELVSPAADIGLETVTAVRIGSPFREILEYVDEHAIDLIVMGTHGRTGLSRQLLGSVTEKVVRLSPVPVLTVRRLAEGDER